MNFTDYKLLMFKTLVTFTFSILLATIAFSQIVGNYHIQQFTTENGMPSNGVKGLKWDDKTGFLWIATEAGLARYNGLAFDIFNRENTPGLKQERMYYILKDKAGRIFTADESGQIFIINKNVPQQFEPPFNSNLSNKPKRLDLLIGDKSLQKKTISLLNEQKLVGWERIIEADDSACVVVGMYGLFFYTNPQQNKFIPLSLPEKILSAMMIGGKMFFIDKQKHIYSADKQVRNFEEKKILTTSNVVLNTEAADNIIYWEMGMKNPILFAGKNAWLLNYKDNNIEASLICNAIPSFSYIQSAQYDEKSKTLFIGTDSKGIIIIKETYVKAERKEQTAINERNSYYSQIELPNGNVLTNAGHEIGPQPTSGRLPVQGRFANSVFTNGDSVLWYGQGVQNLGYPCLHKYNYTTGKTVVLEKVEVRETFALLEAENGAVYISTYNGFGLLKNDSVQYLFPNITDKEKTTYPFKIVEMEPGIFASVSCNGLIRYNTKTLAADTILKLPGYCIRTIWKYKDYLFIGTYGKGFYVYKNNKLKLMPLDRNKFLQYTHCFVPDEYGYCWISTNRGLFKAQIADIINAFEKNIPQVYYHYFGKNDGMEITEMNGGCAPCALEMKNKTISFPTMDGLLWVNPGKENMLMPKGEIYIDEFRAGNKKIELEELAKQSLPVKADDIYIKISFPGWSNKENLYIDYKVNNKNWEAVEAGSLPEIKLSNLPSGTYKIIFRKLNGFGADNYSYKEINFSIKTPWYKQWWFYVLAVLFTTGFILLYLKFRTNQFRIRQRKLEQQVAEKTKELKDQNEVLEKNNSIKTRLISIISHDIVTPLKFLTVAGNNLVDNKDKMPEDLQQETIREMANTSQELQLLSTNILNWIKYQNENRRLTKEAFNMHEMVRQVLGILNSLAKQKNLRIVNAIDMETTIYQFYEPMKILVYNLLTNAINFSEKGTITVSVEKRDGSTIVSVQDEGVGMTPEKKQSLMEDHVVISSANVDNRKGHGLGFLIIKDLLSMMGATLKIESTKGVGSTISVFIPV